MCALAVWIAVQAATQVSGTDERTVILDEMVESLLGTVEEVRTVHLVLVAVGTGTAAKPALAIALQAADIQVVAVAGIANAVGIVQAAAGDVANGIAAPANSNVAAAGRPPAGTDRGSQAVKARCRKKPEAKSGRTARPHVLGMAAHATAHGSAMHSCARAGEAPAAVEEGAFAFDTFASPPATEARHIRVPGD